MKARHIGATVLLIFLFLIYLGGENGLFSSERIISTQFTSKCELQVGDIVFQTSQSAQSKAIQLATNSPYSHMGIVFKDKGRFWVFEAVQPVGSVPFNDWVKRGKDHHFVVKRLKNADSLMTKSAHIRLQLEAEKYVGKPYDSYFEWSDDRIYCSELVWKMYRDALGLELGSLQSLSSFNLSHPEVRDIMKKHYGTEVPINEKVISPASVFASDLLEEVCRGDESH